MTHTCPLRYLFDETLERHNLVITPEFEFTEYDSLKQYLINRLGVATVPSTVVRNEIGQGKLVKINWLDEDISVPLWLIWHRDKWMSPAVMAFRELAVEMLGQPVEQAVV